MTDTPISLLKRLRLRPDPHDWKRLVDLYTPLLSGWLKRYGVQGHDADDLIQDTLSVLVQELPTFQHQRTGGFRKWLRNILVNRLRVFWRERPTRPVSAELARLEELMSRLGDPASDLSRQWDQEHDQHVTRQLLEQIRERFEATTWEAFRRFALEGEPAEQVAAALGLTANAVFIAKSRVLSRLRQEGAGLLD